MMKACVLAAALDGRVVPMFNRTYIRVPRLRRMRSLENTHRSGLWWLSARAHPSGLHLIRYAGPSHWSRENTFCLAGCSINQIRDTIAEADKQFGVAVTERDRRGIVVHTDAFLQ